MQKDNLAFIFPGQGSQKVGMLKELAETYPTVVQTFAEASDALGYDMWDLLQNGQQEDINLTERTQPMLLASSVAIWRIWSERQGPVPAYLAGHSLGEWSALVASGVVAFEDAVKLVKMRGTFMQEAVPFGRGAMAAVIGVEDELIRQICRQVAGDEVVSPVNYNSPGQVVIAGDAAAVERAIEGLKAAGAKRPLMLPVSAPFHTSLMRPAADNLAGHVHNTVFKSPTIPVVHNVHARTEADPVAIKALMIEQIYSPVLWVDCMKALSAQGVTHFVECGPGKVLGGLARRIDKSLAVFPTEDPVCLDSALAEV